MFRIAAPLTLSLVLAACAAGGPAPAGLEPTAPPALDSVPAEPAPPEPTLEERWRAPFAVQSSGRVAERPPPVAVTRARTAPAPVVDLPPVSAARDSAAAAAAADATPPPAAGQTPAPAPAPAPAPRPAAGREAPSGSTRTHRVGPGDTWFGISRRYGISTAALSAANPGVDPERIIIGQVVRVPGPDPAPGANRRSHVVEAGDSLWGISRRYGVSVEALRTLNRLPDERVRIGQTLIIPAENEEP